jgi:hypothetical protein
MDMLSKTMTADYLGETIKLLPTDQGWRGWWVHPVMGAFGDGMDYPSYDQALKATEELIRKNGAIDVLLSQIDEWLEAGLICDDEHIQLEVSLLAFVTGY